MKPKLLFILALVVYVTSAGLVYTVNVMGNSSSGGQTSAPVTTQEEETSKLNTLLQIDPAQPKDQVCPLNGAKYTQAEKDAWSKRRPLAIMIENSPDARPQSGLSSADIVYEALAEGGITRFMALYYCGVQAVDTTVAPVRSARSYFVDWASGYNYPLYVHVGGANLPGPADALGQISQYGWGLQNDLNQFSIGYPTFVRNANRLGREVATEHTMESTTEKLWAVAAKRGWTNMSPDRKLGKKVIAGTDWLEDFTQWEFADGQKATEIKPNISYEFWDGYDQFAVSWSYDSTTNTYKRSMAGEAHIDHNNQTQLAASNVIILFTDEKGPIDELKHMLYRTTGMGDVLIFQNGGVVKAKWSKKDRESQLLILDVRGKAVPLARGLTWISVLDTGTAVTY